MYRKPSRNVTLCLFLVANALPTAFLEQVSLRFLVGSPWGHPVHHDICHILEARPWYVPKPSSNLSHSKTTASSRSIELQQTLWCKVYSLCVRNSMESIDMFMQYFDALCPPVWDTFIAFVSSYLLNFIFILCLNSMSAMSALLLDRFVAVPYSIISPQLPGSWREPLRDTAQLLLGLRNNAFARSREEQGGAGLMCEKYWKVMKSQCRSPSVSKATANSRLHFMNLGELRICSTVFFGLSCGGRRARSIAFTTDFASRDSKMEKKTMRAGSWLLLWIGPLLDRGKTGNGWKLFSLMFFDAFSLRLQ